MAAGLEASGQYGEWRSRNVLGLIGVCVGMQHLVRLRRSKVHLSHGFQGDIFGWNTNNKSIYTMIRHWSNCTLQGQKYLYYLPSI